MYNIRNITNIMLASESQAQCKYDATSSPLKSRMCVNSVGGISGGLQTHWVFEVVIYHKILDYFLLL